MVLGRRMQRRLVIAGLASTLAAPVAVIKPTAAAILFTCDSVTGSGMYQHGLVHGQHPDGFGSGPTAPAGPADLILASTSDSGVKGNGLSTEVSLSADGTKVAFRSQATNLDPADTDSTSDIYVKNLTTGDITLVSTSDTGVKGNGPSSDPSVSADGTKIAFGSDASNLDLADPDAADDIYVKNLTTGDITLASTSDTGVNSSGETLGPELSPDGTHVAFESRSTTLDPGDTDIIFDVYVKNLTTGDITLASTSDTGVKGNGHSNHPSLSEDGSRVAFDSGASNLEPGGVGFTSVYVKNLATGDITLASTSDSGVDGDFHSTEPALSDDGTRVAFASTANNLDSADTDRDNDVYVKDLTTGDLTLASISDGGVKGDDHSFDPAVAGDATTVLVRSFANNLDLAHSPGSGADAYVKDLASGDVTVASTSDFGVSGNDFSMVAIRLSLSVDGSQAAFSTNDTNLDPADTDSLNDVYVKQLPSVPTSMAIGDCSNGQTGTVSVVELRSYGARPLGCPVSLGGAAGNDYPDQTPVLLGTNPSLRIDWASGPDSFGVAKLKMGTTGTQWRAVLAIQASPGHTTPATNQYLPAAGSGLTKTKLKGRIDWSALDSFDCTSGTADPLSWLDLVNNGAWIAKNQ
jgi:Tol biopolymer transport system component